MEGPVKTAKSPTEESSSPLSSLIEFVTTIFYRGEVDDILRHGKKDKFGINWILLNTFLIVLAIYHLRQNLPNPNFAQNNYDWTSLYDRQARRRYRWWGWTRIPWRWLWPYRNNFLSCPEPSTPHQRMQCEQSLANLRINSRNQSCFKVLAVTLFLLVKVAWEDCCDEVSDIQEYRRLLTQQKESSRNEIVINVKKTLEVTSLQQTDPIIPTFGKGVLSCNKATHDDSCKCDDHNDLDEDQDSNQENQDSRQEKQDLHQEVQDSHKENQDSRQEVQDSPHEDQDPHQENQDSHQYQDEDMHIAPYESDHDTDILEPSKSVAEENEAECRPIASLEKKDFRNEIEKLNQLARTLRVEYASETNAAKQKRIKRNVRYNVNQETEESSSCSTLSTTCSSTTTSTTSTSSSEGIIAKESSESSTSVLIENTPTEIMEEDWD